MPAAHRTLELPPSDMAWIAGGTFAMGSADFYPDERPVYEVPVDGFWIDVHPVTVADFARFVAATAYVTLAERPPDPALYPEVTPEDLVPGRSSSGLRPVRSCSTTWSGGGPGCPARAGGAPTVRAAPRAQDAQTLAGRAADAYLGTDAQTLGGKPASAFLGSDKQLRTDLIKLMHGETKTVASSGPFTWEAACSEVGAETRLEVTVESSEADSFAGAFDPSLSQPVGPGAPATVFEAQSPAPVYTIGFPLSAVAPSGAAPLGLGFAGIQVAGADCVVNGTLWP